MQIHVSQSGICQGEWVWSPTLILSFAIFNYFAVNRISNNCKYGTCCTSYPGLYHLTIHTFISYFMIMILFQNILSFLPFFLLSSFLPFFNIQEMLVLCVLSLTGKTLQLMKGNHGKKTLNFVKACFAFCHITVPSVSDVILRLRLLLHCAEYALLNRCLPQTDTFLKAAISLYPDIPVSKYITLWVLLLHCFCLHLFIILITIIIVIIIIIIFVIYCLF